MLAAGATMLICGGGSGPVAGAQVKSVLPNHGLSVSPVSAETIEVSGGKVRFVYQNLSDREVKSVLFDAAYRDDAEQLHHVEVHGGYHQRVSPGELKVGELEVKMLRRIHPKEILLWPVLVMYKDGSVWDIHEPQ